MSRLALVMELTLTWLIALVSVALLVIVCVGLFMSEWEAVIKAVGCYVAITYFDNTLRRSRLR